MAIDKFSSEVCDKLGYYVYGLIDPRNGRYFYIDKGQGNRIFQHIKGIKDVDDIDEDEIDGQIMTIRDIHNAGLEVIHIIIRHGLRDNQEALNIESMLIDFIGLHNLDNKVGGINQDKGINNAQILQKRYTTTEFIENKNTPPFIIIKIRQNFIDERGSHYEACRSAWRVRLASIQSYKYVLCVVNGIVEKVFEVEQWYQIQSGRYEFKGKEAKQDICDLFINKRIPEHYRKKGMASPVVYSKNRGEK